MQASHPRVLFITSVFPPVVGGSAVVYQNLCRMLGHDAAVLTGSRDYRTNQELPGWRESDANLPYTVSRLNLLRPLIHEGRDNLPSKLWRLLVDDWPCRRAVLCETLRLVDQFRPDCAIIGELYPLHWLGFELRRRRVPVLHYVHGEEVAMRNSSKLLSSKVMHALQEAEGVIAVSSFTLKLLLELGVRPERLHLVRNGVDAERFTPGQKDTNLLRKHGLEGKRLLVSVSRFEPKKGQDTLIRAMGEILHQLPDTRLLLVGDGAYREALIAIASQCGVSSSVVFSGEVTPAELPAYYRLADVFALPNRALEDGNTEGFGLIFLEAGACGKAVLGGIDGGVCDAILPGETGIQVDGRVVADVAGAAIHLLRNAELAHQMGLAGRAFAERSTWIHRFPDFIGACQAAAQPAR